MRLLLPAVLFLSMSVPATALSTVTLPISVPLAGVQAAANARVPDEFARLDQTQSFLGGLLSVKLTGTVSRAGPVTVKPDGQALLVSVPIRAEVHAAPGGVGSVLARDFAGAATVSLRVTPQVTPDWQAGVKVTGDYAWTDPLSVELAQGVKVSVKTLVDAQVRAQLERVTADIEQAVREGANLRGRAGTLWARVQQPWTLPTPQPTFALVKPVMVSVTPFAFTPDALNLTVAGQFDLRAGLGQAPPVTSTPLPALKVQVVPAAPGIELTLPVTLPYPELSRLATAYAVRERFTLPVPTSPTLQVGQVTVKPAGHRLLTTVQVQLSGPLGLRVNATVDVTGTPVLNSATQTVTLKDVQVQTRRDGLSGRIIGLLGDSRAQAYLARAAHFDLTPYLEKARAQAQARLPMTPAPGIVLAGRVEKLRVTELTVQQDALLVRASAGGNLNATVDAAVLH